MAFGKNKGSESTSTSTGNRQQKRAKKTWVQVVVMIIKRIFKWLRQLLSVLYEILQEILNTTVYLFSIALKFISSPSTPCLLAISVFGLVMIVTTAQWWGVGVWLGKLLGLGGAFGAFRMGAGAAGMFLGLCLNIFQLSSEMWKISRQFAEYYAAKDIKVDMDSDDSEADKNVKTRLNNWLSHDHSTLKRFRSTTYILETGLMISYTLLANMSFWGLVLGGIALIAPELTIKLVSATISLLGGVSQDSDEEPEQYSI
ncbi:MAG: hypothetical protein HC907_14990 [Richelia sp. SM1_7_0]|nr:hypothetical protein [Richelia sp. SM1_7_0]